MLIVVYSLINGNFSTSWSWVSVHQIIFNLKSLINFHVNKDMESTLHLEYIVCRLYLREKCPNTEFFLVCIFPHSDWIRRNTYSVRMQENTDQRILRIWTLFKQCISPKWIVRRVLSCVFPYFPRLHCVKSGCFRSYSGPHFPHSDWLRSSISPNTDTFHAILMKVNLYFDS